MKINSFLRDQGLFAFLLVLWLEKIAQFTPATLELHPLSRIKSVIWQNIICITMIDVKSYAHFSSMSMEQNMEFQLNLLYDQKISFDEWSFAMWAYLLGFVSLLTMTDEDEYLKRGMDEDGSFREGHYGHWAVWHSQTKKWQNFTLLFVQPLTKTAKIKYVKRPPCLTIITSIEQLTNWVTIPGQMSRKEYDLWVRF